MLISIVIPFYNEEQNVIPLVEELMRVPLATHVLEGLLVDDGSTDHTWSRIHSCTQKHDRLRGIRLPNNQGQSFALLVGLKAAQGGYLITLDGDGQNDPNDIPTLLSMLNEWDVVCGVRAYRKDGWTRRAGSVIANKVRNWITHDGVIDTGCTLKAFKRDCLNDLPPFDGVHRFMPAYFRLHNRLICQKTVHHRPRLHGHSKYTHLQRLPQTLFDLVGFVWYRRRLLNLRTEPAPPRKTDQERNQGKQNTPS